MSFSQVSVSASALDQFRLDNNAPAKNWNEIVGTGKMLPSLPKCPLGGVYNATYSETDGYKVTCSVTGHSVEALAAASRVKPGR